MSPILFWVFLSVFFAVQITLSAASFPVIFTIIINVSSSVLSNINLVAFLTLIDVTVFHSWMLVKFGEVLDLSALKALFLFHTHLYY